MDADVIINGGTLELHGKVVATDEGIFTVGKQAGLGFESQDDSKNLFVWYANNNRASLWVNANPKADLLNIDIEGNFLALKKEISTKGPLAGYSFCDRIIENDRFVWYAHDHTVRLWNSKAGPSGGDILTIHNGELTTQSVSTQNLNFKACSAEAISVHTASAETMTADSVVAKSIRINYVVNFIEHRTMDLLQTILDLKKRVEALENKNNEKGQPSGN